MTELRGGLPSRARDAQGTLDGVPHLRSTRDNLGVRRLGCDGDDEAVLVADGHFTHSMKITGG